MWEEKLKAYQILYPDQSVTEAVYKILLDEIVSFQLPPSTMLILAHLSDEFGVSRTPVRDAIAKLSEMRLVNITGSKKAVVSEYDPKTSSDLQIFRETLEVYAATLACQAASDETIAELSDMVERNTALFYEAKRTGSEDMLNALISSDLQFHLALVRSSGSKLLIRQFEKIYPCMVFIRQFFSPFDFTPMEYPEAHQVIINALKTRSVQYAKAAVGLHFRALATAKRLDG